MNDSDTRRWVVTGIGVGVVVLLGVGAMLATRADEHAKQATEHFCTRLRSTQDIEAVLTTRDPKKVEVAARQLRTLTASAPGSVQPDLRTLSSYVDLVAAGLANVAPDDDVGARAVFEQLRSQVPDVDKAGAAVEAWAKSTCSLDLHPTAPPTTTGPPTTSTSATTTTVAAPTD